VRPGVPVKSLAHYKSASTNTQLDYGQNQDVTERRSSKCKSRRNFTWSGNLCLIVAKSLPEFYLRLR
jgi:hypothetical protein